MASKKRSTSTATPSRLDSPEAAASPEMPSIAGPAELGEPTLDVASISSESALSATPPAPTVAVVVSHKEQKLIEWMMAHPNEVIRQRQEMLMTLAKRRCTYGRDGGTMPVTLTPLFLSQAALNKVKTVGETFDRIIDKVVNGYRDDPRVRAHFPYTEIPKEWIDWDPGYAKPTVLNRHDALFDGKNLKFIEFNTDNPGGRAWCDTLEEIFRSYPMYQDLISSFTPKADRAMLRAGVDALLHCYKDAGGTKEKPRIGIVSFKEYLPGSDMEITRDYLVEHGYDAHFMDARDFEYRDGGLYSNRVRFDLLNLALRFLFFKRFPREMKDFLEGIRDRGVVCVNPWRATIGAQKEAMSFISNPENHGYFTEEEVAVIKEHLPWTRKLDETITMSPDGSDISLQEYMVKNKERLVLKPGWGAGGQDVKVGRTTDTAEWNSVVSNVIGCPWWVVQEAVPVPEYEMPVLKGGKVVLEKKFLNINPYIFDGKYAGCLGRVSASNVVNVSSGGGIIPIFPLKED
ncbi:MAG: hypothetical protein HY816_10645 [Candidatus Wallbacteria bacterium]|nr:hypothetical protein [Candidatus Wallbacteria bacterium]